MQKHTCQNCRKKFSSSWGPRIYCSTACRIVAQRASPQTATCEICGTVIRRVMSRRRGHIFCSYACRAIWQARNSVRIKCKQCGVEFTVPSCVASRKNGVPRKYCSTECFGIASRRGEYRLTATKPQTLEVALWRQHVGWKEFQTAWLATHPTCEECGRRKYGPNLTVHHIQDPNASFDVTLLFSPPNLRVLCRSCHCKVHNLLRKANGSSSGDQPIISQPSQCNTVSTPSSEMPSSQ